MGRSSARSSNLSLSEPGYHSSAHVCSAGVKWVSMDARCTEPQALGGHRKSGKMVDFIPIISIITLNVNVLNTTIE